MATPGQERELLKKGLEQDGLVRGVWAQNMWLDDGSVSVRPGWGVLAELDTTLGSDVTFDSSGSPAVNFTTNKFGYEKHLGSGLVETVFGHQQVVSVFSARVSVGSLGGDSRVGLVGSYYVARIFDITTNRSWEEVLTHKTSEMATSSKQDSLTDSGNYPCEWYGSYETAFDKDNTAFIPSNADSDWFFFTSRGLLYFGSGSSGVFTYRPADFGASRSMQTQIDSLFNWSSGHSETALIERIHFTNGIFEDGFVYASESNISKIVAATSFRGRVAYATEYEIWFSDQGRSNNIIANNFINVPSSRKVTAMSEFKGNLLIFTDREMYLYIPSEGTIVSQGRPPIKVSESVGCIGQQAISMMEDNLVWVSSSGVFITSSGTDVKELSEPIRAFWGSNGLMTNPMTSYYEANAGWIDIDLVSPPRTLLSFNPDRVSVAYNHSKRTLVMSCPSVNGCWAFSGLWSWWPMESSVNGDSVSGAPIVSTTSNLVEPWVLATTEDIFCVSGTMYDEIPDASFSFVGGSIPNAYPDVAATPIASPSKGYNFVISKLGYGGALDRSSYQEDFRLGGDKYIPVITPDASFTNGAFYFEKPIEEEDPTTGQLYYWLPIELVPPVNAGAMTGYELLFQFDNAEWDAEPSATSIINVRFPTERLGSTPGLTANTSTSAPAPSPTGNYIHLVFDGTAVANTWTTWPALGVAQRNKNPLIYIRFKKKTASSVMGMGIIPTRSIVSFGGLPLAPIVGALVWTSQSIGAANSHDNDAKAQCVDWSYKSEEISEGGGHIKARGIYAVMNSQGRGLLANRLVPGWLWGIYNVILGSDSKEFTSQIVDYDNDLKKIVDKGTLRSRFRNLAGGNMTTRTFSGEPKWGSQGNNFYGDYLIDDQQTDDIATSDSVKGQRISYMVFGFIQDKAEALSIRNLTGIFRRAGTRRRTGR